ncbi:MAG: glycosyltransferase family 9 protein [Ignavibacteriae bacterium]|nr:glycosyltransferase family 9 protein [Ignavibacteriota bacterium]
MKILFIQLGKIGDMILLTPLFRAVKEKYPDSEIDIIASRRNNMIIRNNPFLNNIIVYEKTPIKFINTIRQIRKVKYDYYIDPKDHYSSESKLFAKLVRSKIKIGFNADGSKLFDISIPSDKENVRLHCTERFFNSLNTLAIPSPVVIPKPELNTNEDSDYFTENFLKDNLINKYFIINISATVPRRMFSAEKWINILSEFRSQNNFILTFAPAENSLAEQLKESLPNLILFPSRSIIDIISLVKKADKIITVDTAIVHIAAAFNKPVLCFYIGEAEQIKKYYPLSDTAFVMQSASSDESIMSINTDLIRGKLTEFLNQ